MKFDDKKYGTAGIEKRLALKQQNDCLVRSLDQKHVLICTLWYSNGLSDDKHLGKCKNEMQDYPTLWGFFFCNRHPTWSQEKKN